MSYDGVIESESSTVDFNCIYKLCGCLSFHWERWPLSWTGWQMAWREKAGLPSGGRVPLFDEGTNSGGIALSVVGWWPAPVYRGVCRGFYRGLWEWPEGGVRTTNMSLCNGPGPAITWYNLTTKHREVAMKDHCSNIGSVKMAFVDIATCCEADTVSYSLLSPWLMIGFPPQKPRPNGCHLSLLTLGLMGAHYNIDRLRSGDYLPFPSLGV